MTTKEDIESAELFMAEKYGTGYSPDKNFCMHFGPNDMKEAYLAGCQKKESELRGELEKSEAIEIALNAEIESLLGRTEISS
jgi:hypothetical protein